MIILKRKRNQTVRLVDEVPALKRKDQKRKQMNRTALHNNETLKEFLYFDEKLTVPFKSNKLISKVTDASTSSNHNTSVCTKSNDTDQNISSNTSDDLDSDDDLLSVSTGLLDEDICLHCGISTLNTPDQWQNVLLCDVCDGEYHLQCTKLERIPRSLFICYKCEKETKHMRSLRFIVSENFKVTRSKLRGVRDICYSVSKPLKIAFDECIQKGFMVVSELFSYQIMKKLTHGEFQKFSASGRCIDSWNGAAIEMEKRFSSTMFQGIVNRDGRYDLSIPDFVVEELKLETILDPLLKLLQSIMVPSPAPQIRTHNIVFVPIGCHSQQWHTDDTIKKYRTHRYFTILIHLNSLDSNCGGTEIWSEAHKKSDLIRARPGDALVFNGSLLHRGHANQGKAHRFFYYCSYACGNDANA